MDTFDFNFSSKIGVSAIQVNEYAIMILGGMDPQTGANSFHYYGFDSYEANELSNNINGQNLAVSMPRLLS